MYTQNVCLLHVIYCAWLWSQFVSYPVETPFKLEYHEISFVHNLFLGRNGYAFLYRARQWTSVPNFETTGQLEWKLWANEVLPGLATHQSKGAQPW